MSFGVEAKRGKYPRKSCPKLILPNFSHSLLQIRIQGLSFRLFWTWSFVEDLDFFDNIF